MIPDPWPASTLDVEITPSPLSALGAALAAANEEPTSMSLYDDLQEIDGVDDIDGKPQYLDFTAIDRLVRHVAQIFTDTTAAADMTVRTYIRQRVPARPRAYRRRVQRDGGDDGDGDGDPPTAPPVAPSHRAGAFFAPCDLIFSTAVRS